MGLTLLITPDLLFAAHPPPPDTGSPFRRPGVCSSQLPELAICGLLVLIYLKVFL